MPAQSHILSLSLSLSVVTFMITTSGELVVGATNTNITCTVTVDIPVDELQITLFADVVNMAVEPDPNNLDSDSVTLAHGVLQTQNAGMYICSATVSDNASITEFNVSKTYTLNISSKYNSFIACTYTTKYMYSQLCLICHWLIY